MILAKTLKAKGFHLPKIIRVGMETLEAHNKPKK